MSLFVFYVRKSVRQVWDDMTVIKLFYKYYLSTAAWKKWVQLGWCRSWDRWHSPASWVELVRTPCEGGACPPRVPRAEGWCRCSGCVSCPPGPPDVWTGRTGYENLGFSSHTLHPLALQELHKSQRSRRREPADTSCDTKVRTVTTTGHNLASNTRFLTKKDRAQYEYGDGKKYFSAFAFTSKTFFLNSWEILSQKYWIPLRFLAIACKSSAFP